MSVEGAHTPGRETNSTRAQNVTKLPQDKHETQIQGFFVTFLVLVYLTSFTSTSVLKESYNKLTSGFTSQLTMESTNGNMDIDTLPCLTTFKEGIWLNSVNRTQVVCCVWIHLTQLIRGNPIDDLTTANFEQELE